MTRPSPSRTISANVESGICSVQSDSIECAGADVDRRAGEHQPAHLAGKARRIDERHPAALAEADEVDRWPQLVDHHVEIGEVVVDARNRMSGPAERHSVR